MKNTTANDWEATLTALSEQKNWEEMWRLVTDVPVKWSIRFLLQLKETNWQPKREAERAAFTNLVRLAKECSQIEAPTPGKFVHCYARLPDCHVSALHSTSPDNSLIVSPTVIQQTASVQLRSLLDGRVLKTFIGHIRGTFSPDGHILATDSLEEHTVQLWSLPDGEPLNKLTGPANPVGRVEISPDGQILAGGAREEHGATLWLWNLPDGTPFEGLEGENIQVHWFGFSPDGHYLLAGRKRPKLLWLWSLPNGMLLKKFDGETLWVNHFLFSPDGHTFVFGDAEGIVHLWNLPEEETIKTLTSHKGVIVSLTFCQNGQILASGDSQGTVCIWSMPDGMLLQKFDKHRRCVDVALSPDGKLLVSKDESGVMRLWDIPTGLLLKRLKGHYLSFTISADGQFLAGGAWDDGSLGLWNLPKGEFLKRLIGHAGNMNDIAMTPDSRVLMSRGDEGVVRLWRLGWSDVRQILIKHTSSKDLQFVTEMLQKDDLPETDRTWLKFLRALMCRHFSVHGHTLLQADKSVSASPLEEQELQRFLDLCHNADEPETALQSCLYLISHNHPEAIDILCARWMTTREPLLARAIFEEGYVANTPFAVRIYSALQANRKEPVIEGGVAAIAPLLDAREDADASLATRARKMLTQLLEQPEAQEELCRLMIEQDHPVAHELVLTEQYTPHDRNQRALFYFLTEQWEKYEQFDVEQHFLQAIYPMLSSDIRKRLVKCARRSGHVEWMTNILGIQQENRSSRMTDEEWENTLIMLSKHNTWKEIWRMLQNAPAERSVQLLLQLKGASWLPEHQTEQMMVKELMCLAEHCTTEQTALPEGVVSCRVVLQEHNSGITCLSIDSEGRLLAGGDQYGDVHLWHLPRPTAANLLHTMSTGFIWGQGDDVLIYKGKHPSEGVVWPSGDSLLMDAQSDEPDAETEIPLMQVPVCGVVISFDPPMLIIASPSGTLWGWHLPNDSAPKMLLQKAGDGKSIKMKADSRVLTFGNPYGGTIQQIRLPDGKVLNTLKRRSEPITSEEFILMSQENCITIHPEQQILISGNADGTIQIWRLWDGTELRKLEGHTASVECVAISSDGQLLVSGSRDNTITLWRISNGETLNILEGHTKPVISLAISQDGRLLASGSHDHTIRLWSLSDGKLLQKLEGHTDNISCLAMSDDGNFLASGSVEVGEAPKGILGREFDVEIEV